MRKLTLLAALLLLVQSFSQAKSLEDLLVEKGVITKGEAAGSSHETAGKVYWDNGTRLDFADVGFTAKIHTKIRTRYEFTDTDQDVSPGTTNVSSFRVRNARIGVTGSALHEEFNYKLEAEFAGAGGGRLTDAYLQWNACDWGNLKMGQFKPAVSRQYNTSISNLQFADRSAVSDYFAFDRNQGASTAIGLNDDWTLGLAVFNGNSAGEGINSTGADTKHLGVVSIRGDVMGEMNPFVEGDVDNTEDTAVNVGVTAGFSQNELGGTLGSTDEFVLSADFNVKNQGWSVHGEYFYLEHDSDLETDTRQSTGFYAQIGYFVAPKEWELAARYGYLDCDSGRGIGNDISGGLNGGMNVCAGADNVNEIDFGVNYYWWKHNMKAQMGFTLLNTDLVTAVNGENDTQENRWIFQLSSYF